MKFIGFVKEHGDDPFAHKLKPYYLSGNDINPHRETVIEYLKKGMLCVPFMGIAQDEDDNDIGYIAVDTDGEWLWPEYFVNYLEKYPNFKVEDNFVQYVLQHKDREIVVTEENISKLEKEFYRIAGFK